MPYLDIVSGRVTRKQRYDLLDNVDFQASSSKPTVRSDGSALVVGDRWLETSGDYLNWFWNGTYWVGDFRTTTVPLSSPTATTSLGFLTGMGTGNNLILVRLLFSARFGAPQNGTDYWTASIERYSTGGSAATSLNTLSTSSQTITSGSEARSFSDTLNLHQDITALNLAYYRFALRRVVSAGGLADPLATIVYRLAKA